HLADAGLDGVAVVHPGRDGQHGERVEGAGRLGEQRFEDRLAVGVAVEGVHAGPYCLCLSSETLRCSAATSSGARAAPVSTRRCRGSSLALWRAETSRVPSEPIVKVTVTAVPLG